MALCTVPEELLDKLKCSICYELLSYAPIYYHPETGSICGRHPFVDSGKDVQPIHEKNYEHITEHMLFPCRYKSNGCSEKYTIIQMPEHEESCDHKTYFCPVLPLGDCAWQGAPKELYGHFATNHQMLLLEKTEFELDIVNNYKEHYLIPFFGEQFLMRTEYQNSDKMFRCRIHYIGKQIIAEQYEYQVEFKAKESESSWCYSKIPVESDAYILEPINECAVTLEKLKELLDEPAFITCEVHITEIETAPMPNENTCNLEIDDIVKEEKILEISKLNISEEDKFLESIECQVCQEYMIPPIYQCVVGHNICEICKPQLNDCPTCREKIASTRNFALEKLTEIMQYPCKNIDEGCTFRTNSLLIRNHEKDCEFQPKECIFKNSENCQWTGKLNNLIHHCKQEHSRNVQNGPYFQTTYNPDCENFEVFKIKSEFGLLFKLLFSYNKDDFSCTVLCAIPPKDNSKFMYEIEMMDLNNIGLKLISKKMCGSISDRKNDMKHCTIWNINMIKPFISVKDVKLRIRCVISKH